MLTDRGGVQGAFVRGIRFRLGESVGIKSTSFEGLNFFDASIMGVGPGFVGVDILMFFRLVFRAGFFLFFYFLFNFFLLENSAAYKCVSGSIRLRLFVFCFDQARRNDGHILFA